MIGHVLADVTPYLRCPLCGSDVTLAESVLGCTEGHRFDVARQGYVSMLPGDARAGTADTAAMVAARAQFLASGAYAPLTRTIAHIVDDTTASTILEVPGCVVDVGGGTGHHLAAVLDACPGRVGVCCDLSRYAARRAARAHPRVGAVVADVWRGVPVRDHGAAVVVNVFAPRNPAEFARVLHPGGVLVVATPQPDHLGELVHRLGLVSVDEQKPRRLREALDRWFTPVATRPLRWSMRLSRQEVRALVEMGPSAWHIDAVDDRVAALPEPVEVTAAVAVSTYRPEV
jgi:23S rRNA (guanine745-N1)-methyltransferase